MSLRTTLALVAAALIVGVIAYVNPFAKGEKEERERPWFYLVAEDDIETIGVTHQGNDVEFIKIARNQWEFTEPAGIPPSHVRWGGVVLLLSGPQTNRDLTITAPTIDDRAQYGLEDPVTTVTVSLTKERQLEFRMGDKTTDGGHYYGEVLGFPQLFLIAREWGNVISRLAAEPPLPKWYVDRDPETLYGMAMFMGNPTDKETPKLAFARRKGEWFVQDRSVDERKVPVNMEQWEPFIPLLVTIPPPTVVVASVEDQDYTPWGIDDDSIAFEIEWESFTERGTEFTDAVGFQLGDKTADGKHYFAKYVANIFQFRLPVLHLDAEWVDALLGLWDAIPYDFEERARLQVEAVERAKVRAVRATATAEAEAESGSSNR